MAAATTFLHFAVQAEVIILMVMSALRAVSSVHGAVHATTILCCFLALSPQHRQGRAEGSYVLHASLVWDVGKNVIFLFLSEARTRCPEGRLAVAELWCGRSLTNNPYFSYTGRRSVEKQLIYL